MPFLISGIFLQMRNEEYNIVKFILKIRNYYPEKHLSTHFSIKNW